MWRILFRCWVLRHVQRWRKPSRNENYLSGLTSYNYNCVDCSPRELGKARCASTIHSSSVAIASGIAEERRRKEEQCLSNLSKWWTPCRDIPSPCQSFSLNRPQKQRLAWQTPTWMNIQGLRNPALLIFEYPHGLSMTGVRGSKVSGKSAPLLTYVVTLCLGDSQRTTQVRN